MKQPKMQQDYLWGADLLQKQQKDFITNSN